MDLTKKQLEILNASGHLLVTGGPGSGKTTVAIFKAARHVKDDLMPGQRILFLSFARASVSRVREVIEHEKKIPKEQLKYIEVGTYHSFFWRIIKTHGYLLGLPKSLNVLRTPNEAVALSSIRSEIGANKKISDAQKAEKHRLEKKERERLAMEEALVCFGLFAKYAGKILYGSKRIRQLIANAYPIIILDEFQDTTNEQWHVVKTLGSCCRLISLADPEQCIYAWAGADPERLSHFREKFNPKEFDLSIDNHRSPETEILLFGNDILKRQQFSQKQYRGISRVYYRADQALITLMEEIRTAKNRLINSNRINWSLAVLVPNKKTTRLISDILRNPPDNQEPVIHTVVAELEGAILGAEVIAHLLEPGHNDKHFTQFIELVCNYFRGRKGDKPTKGDVKEATRIHDAYEKFVKRISQGKKMHQKSVLANTLEDYNQARELIWDLTGNPDIDWRTMVQLVENGKCTRLKKLIKDVRNLRLLDRGNQLRRDLVDDWRENGAYTRALSIVRQAFMQEHFITSQKPETDVIVMNMHKAKGKQFDEVIIFEDGLGDIRTNRIVWLNNPENDDDKGQARQNFRVSITRSKLKTTILTPERDPCILLPPRN